MFKKQLIINVLQKLRQWGGVSSQSNAGQNHTRRHQFTPSSTFDESASADGHGILDSASTAVTTPRQCGKRWRQLLPSVMEGVQFSRSAVIFSKLLRFDFIV